MGILQKREIIVNIDGCRPRLLRCRGFGIPNLIVTSDDDFQRHATHACESQHRIGNLTHTPP